MTLKRKIDWRFVMVSAMVGGLTAIVMSYLRYPPGKPL
jgi:hypothetical protein